VFAVAGVDTLDVRLVPVTCRVERWSAGHLGEIGGEALFVVRVKPGVRERVLRQQMGKRGRAQRPCSRR
jgi:hypothetical protein